MNNDHSIGFVYLQHVNIVSGATCSPGSFSWSLCIIACYEVGCESALFNEMPPAF